MKKIKLFLFLCFLLSAALSFAQSEKLIDYIHHAELNAVQEHYFNAAMKSPFAVDAVFANINFAVLNQSSITVNLPGELHFVFIKENRALVPEGRTSWIGRLQDSYQDAIHLAYKKGSKNLVGQLQVDDVSYVITPLSGGLHAIIRYDMAIDDDCETPSGDFKYDGPGQALKGNTYSNPDLLGKKQNQNNQRATGECNIRVLVAYTDDVDLSRVDIYSDIVTMVNSSNTGYANSLISYSIELAMAYEVDYVETGNMVTDLLCIANTSDACLDDIHVQRALWSADQVMLLTVNGSGIAFVSTAYGNQFAVVGQGNFGSYSFQHELGHNAQCTHATTQTSSPGTAPYAGYGHPTGCFRTVMAYNTSCGAGACPRHNVFSANVAADWSCGASTLIRGNANARNSDRLVLSRPIIVAHEAVANNTTYSGNYDWNIREAVHFAANNTLTYSSASNNFEFHSGSVGSFRASDKVILGRGFRAKSGSSFRGYLETCTPLRPEASSNPENGSAIGKSKNQLTVYPNPFTNQTNIEYTLHTNSSVKIWVTDVLGRYVASVSSYTDLQAGTYKEVWDASAIQPGMYLCHFMDNNKHETKRLLIQK